MTELETKIWNTVHNWCDAQSSEIPDQNRRFLMDEIKALVSSHCVEQSEKCAHEYVETSIHSVFDERCKKCGHRF